MKKSNFVRSVDLGFVITLLQAGAALGANVFTSTASLGTPRYNHTSALLPSGKVLVAGGNDDPGSGPASLATAELYDPATGAWSPTGSFGTAREYHAATLLPNGKVLVAGGYSRDYGTSGFILGSVELYDPATGTWSPRANLSTLRFSHFAALLTNGMVLVAGGATKPAASRSCTIPRGQSSPLSVTLSGWATAHSNLALAA